MGREKRGEGGGQGVKEGDGDGARSDYEVDGVRGAAVRAEEAKAAEKAEAATAGAVTAAATATAAAERAVERAVKMAALVEARALTTHALLSSPTPHAEILMESWVLGACCHRAPKRFNRAMARGSMPEGWYYPR